MAVPVHPQTQPQVAAGPLRAAASFNHGMERTADRSGPTF